MLFRVGENRGAIAPEMSSFEKGRILVLRGTTDLTKVQMLAIGTHRWHHSNNDNLLAGWQALCVRVRS